MSAPCTDRTCLMSIENYFGYVLNVSTISACTPSIAVQYAGPTLLWPSVETPLGAPLIIYCLVVGSFLPRQRH